VQSTKQTDPLESTVPLVVSIIGVVFALAGLFVLVWITTRPSPSFALGTEATSGDVSVWVESYQWLDADHGGGDNEGSDNGDGHDDDPVDPNQDQIDNITAQGEVFAMPANMMPGQPTNGFQRIQINISMLNRAGVETPVHPDHFRLEVVDGSRWITLQGGTFVSTTIGPNQAFSTVLAYDVQDDSANRDMVLVWDGEGGDVRFALSGAGHIHG